MPPLQTPDMDVADPEALDDCPDQSPLLTGVSSVDGLTPSSNPDVMQQFARPDTVYMHTATSEYGRGAYNRIGLTVDDAVAEEIADYQEGLALTLDRGGSLGEYVEGNPDIGLWVGERIVAMFRPLPTGDLDVTRFDRPEQSHRSIAGVNSRQGSEEAEGTSSLDGVAPRPIEIKGRWSLRDRLGQVVGETVVVSHADWVAMPDDLRPNGIPDKLGRSVLIDCPVGWGECAAPPGPVATDLCDGPWNYTLRVWTPEAWSALSPAERPGDSWEMDRPGWRCHIEKIGPTEGQVASWEQAEKSGDLSFDRMTGEVTFLRDRPAHR